MNQVEMGSAPIHTSPTIYRIQQLRDALWYALYYNKRFAVFHLWDGKRVSLSRQPSLGFHQYRIILRLHSARPDRHGNYPVLVSSFWASNKLEVAIREAVRLIEVEIGYY